MTQGHNNKVGIGDVESLKGNRAWKEIVRNLLEARASLQDKVNTIGADAERIYTQRDVDIVRMQEIDNLIAMPDKFLDFLKDTAADDFDPYK